MSTVSAVVHGSQEVTASRPQPVIRQLILKVHSGHNLACDQCYVYEARDQSAFGPPHSMADRTVCAVAERIAEHADHHGVDRVHIVLHGGEPLLLGPSGLRWIFSTIRSSLVDIAAVDFGVYTNAVQLDERFAELFLAADVKVAISLDGVGRGTDHHRRFAGGGSRHDPVVRAMRLLGSPDFQSVFAGVLSTIDAASDPVQVLEDLSTLHPPTIDLLLPHASRQRQPAGTSLGRTPYGDWLITAFDRWRAMSPRIGIPLLDQVGQALHDGASRSEVLALAVPDRIVIETDGSIEQDDAARLSSLITPRFRNTILEHSLDDVVARRPDADQPSVYCQDLVKLIAHIQDRMTADQPTTGPDLIQV